ncbi:MAG: 50S ribosomal protein L29 [Patescibacteria group bacterium]|nr:50S ribosomal protein L29 [Patescibacteria group bacterium]
MNYKELKKKKTKDLHKILAEARNKLREFRFKDANKQLKDVRVIRKTRNTISRVLTLLNIKSKDYDRKKSNN